MIYIGESHFLLRSHSMLGIPALVLVPLKIFIIINILMKVAFPLQELYSRPAHTLLLENNVSMGTFQWASVQRPVGNELLL